mmetsp:Transcript_1408/g.2006  ORF Transcript_1408/g.2006 Transcript_1408/m.2006 type:complete len:222 (-) Transcript_1408:261-926(-)|eukprot:CAMPEP_0196587094 /NCGR_PEP_ID=MMETSP1081-20130531/56433_1 /TAXON_ID=36882 /ORGANISM="Pyramimonas amylifera, Strain CCMP720" /LENGTH=221 /DNA_ID=CAMNT_0041909185 /DNA_START=604 /DNA_END=1269 /DNA_ORIENTATION=+
MDGGKRRALSTKRQFELFLSSTERDRQLALDDLDEEEEDMQRGLQCPYCRDELRDVTSLCTHLENHHPFEAKISQEHGRRMNNGQSSSSASSSRAAASAQLAHTWRRVSSHPGAPSQGTSVSFYTKDSRGVAALLSLNARNQAALPEDPGDPPAPQGALHSAEEPCRKPTPLPVKAVTSSPIPQLDTSGALKAAQKQLLSEQNELQAQFIQELLMSSMGLQ